MASPAVKTFLITGVSSGLGRAFAKGTLEAGHRVIGTVRKDGDAEPFVALAPDRAYPLVLDVTHYDAIPAAVAAAERQAGPIDVLVNNAGYGHEGVLEESSIDDLQRQFAANVFGPVAMTKAVLPGMRDGAAVTSSTSPPWAASSPCPGSVSIAAASSLLKAFGSGSARKWRVSGSR